MGVAIYDVRDNEILLISIAMIFTTMTPPLSLTDAINLIWSASVVKVVRLKERCCTLNFEYDWKDQEKSSKLEIDILASSSPLFFTKRMQLTNDIIVAQSLIVVIVIVFLMFLRKIAY